MIDTELQAAIYMESFCVRRKKTIEGHFVSVGGNVIYLFDLFICLLTLLGPCKTETRNVIP